jgi:DNA-directed RNA polymerase alpha subunit
MNFQGCELDTPLISNRVKGLLKEMEIYTVEQLANLSYRAFMNRYGFGKGSLENVIAFLKLKGKELKEMPTARK